MSATDEFSQFEMAAVIETAGFANANVRVLPPGVATRLQRSID